MFTTKSPRTRRNTRRKMSRLRVTWGEFVNRVRCRFRDACVFTELVGVDSTGIVTVRNDRTGPPFGY